MTTTPFEALIVNGARLTPDEELSERVIQRMDTSIDAWDEGLASNMVFTGNHSFLLDEVPSVSEASVMQRYAIEKGVPAEEIFVEDESLETVGNALFTKQRFVAPNDWDRLLIVTSDSHLWRTMGIFKHVLGPDFYIQGIPSPEPVSVAGKVHAMLGDIMMKEVLRGTKPGDDEAIKERLFDLVPGYADGTKARLASRSLLGLLKRS